MLEHGVTLRVSATHENHHLVSEFEGAQFEFYTLDMVNHIAQEMS